MNNAVFSCCHWDSHGWMLEADVVKDDHHCVRVPFYERVALVVVKGQANVESIIAGAEVPRSSCGRFCMDEHPAPWRGQWGRGIEVEWSIEVFPG